jgi:hypothetical protein
VIYSNTERTSKMKKNIKSIDDRMDYFVSNFYNKLSILFIIKFICTLIILGSLISPILFFQENMGIRIFSVISTLLSPIAFLNAVCALKSANWHFCNTLTQRMTVWFD